MAVADPDAVGCLTGGDPDMQQVGARLGDRIRRSLGERTRSAPDDPQRYILKQNFGAPIRSETAVQRPILVRVEDEVSGEQLGTCREAMSSRLLGRRCCR